MARKRRTRRRQSRATDESPQPARPNGLPTAAVVTLAVAAWLGAMVLATGFLEGAMLTAAAGLYELAWALAIAAAAGGLGSCIVLPIARRGLDRGLACFTSIAAGLWLLATLVLAIGSTGADWLFGPWFWYAVLPAGLSLAVYRTRKQLSSVRIPSHLPASSLLWLIPVAAAGIWLAGAMRPPGYAGLPGDRYDVLLYHLQVPREWMINTRVSTLDHNVYSYYPMGLESLYMVAMALRGGPWQGAYLAKMLHGLHGLLAAGAIWASLRRDNPAVARAAALLTATVPYLLLLSFTAMVELSQLFWLTMSLLWLRQWLRQADWTSGTLLGLSVGASCTVKYLSVGLVALPVAVALLVASAVKPRRFPSAALAILIGLLALSPWLIRNVAATGNPVFPLATQVMGPGAFAPEDQLRWESGHGPEVKPPVPAPMEPFGRKDIRQTDRIAGLWETFFGSTRMNPLLVVLAAVGAVVGCVRFARPGGDPFVLALTGIVLIQVGVWAGLTHEMPPRFFTPALSGLALLAATGLSTLAGPRRWIGEAAAAVVASAGLVMLALQASQAGLTGKQADYIPPAPLSELSANILPRAYQEVESPRPLLIGWGPAFYHPPGTHYATVFDSEHLLDWLAPDATPQQRLDRLEQIGVTHLEVAWSEIRRLAVSYGFPRVLADDVLAARLDRRRPQLQVIEQLKPLGLRELPSANPDVSVYALPRQATPDR